MVLLFLLSVGYIFMLSDFVFNIALFIKKYT